MKAGYTRRLRGVGVGAPPLFGRGAGQLLVGRRFELVELLGIVMRGGGDVAEVEELAPAAGRESVEKI